ncbi:MDMPI_N domain containing protein, partial [Streptomyces viridochromogenes]
LAWLTGERRHTPLHADLDDVDEPLRLGDPTAPRPPARYIGDAATLVRLYAGRPVEGAPYELAGAEAGELNIFG